MKCPNCNVEIEDGSAFCIFCGSPIGEKKDVEEVKEVVKTEEETPVVEETKAAEEPVVEEVKAPQPEVKEEPKVEATPAPEAEKKVEPTATVAPNNTTTKNTQNKKRHSLITVAILAVVMFIAAIVIIAVLLLSGGPEKMYKGAIKEAAKAALANEAVTNERANITATVSLETDIDELEDINGIAANVNMQYDLGTKEFLAKAKLDMGSETYLDGQAFVNLLDKKVFIGEASLFDKLISVEIPEETLEQIETALEEVNIADKKVANTAAERFAKAINDNLPKEYFTKANATIKVDGKDVNVKDNALIISGQNLVDTATNIFTTLKDDEKFLNCYENKDEIKDMLETAIEGMEDAEVEDEVSLQVHYCTSGLFNEFVAASVVLVDEWEDMITLEVMQVEKDVYTVSVKEIYDSEEEELYSAKVKVNKLAKNEFDIEATLEVEDMGDITAKVAMAANYGKAVEALDVANAVAVEDLTEDDMTKIGENLEESPLYELIEDYMGDMYEDDYDYEEEEEVDVDLEDGQAYVMTYDDDIIKFGVPSTFEEDYSGNTYRAYTKNVDYDYAGIDVDAELETMDECSTRIAESLDYLDPEDGYKDMKVSDVEEVEVNGITYKKRTASYTSYDEDYEFTYVTTYYYTKITDEYTYVVTVEDDDNIITDAEVEKFLDIKIELN